MANVAAEVHALEGDGAQAGVRLAQRVLQRLAQARHGEHAPAGGGARAVGVRLGAGKVENAVRRLGVGTDGDWEAALVRVGVAGRRGDDGRGVALAEGHRHGVQAVLAGRLATYSGRARRSAAVS